MQNWKFTISDLTKLCLTSDVNISPIIIYPGTINDDLKKEILDLLRKPIPFKLFKKEIEHVIEVELGHYNPIPNLMEKKSCNEAEANNFIKHHCVVAVFYHTYFNYLKNNLVNKQTDESYFPDFLKLDVLIKSIGQTDDVKINKVKEFTDITISDFKYRYKSEIYKTASIKPILYESQDDLQMSIDNFNSLKILDEAAKLGCVFDEKNSIEFNKIKAQEFLKDKERYFRLNLPF